MKQACEPHQKRLLNPFAESSGWNTSGSPRVWGRCFPRATMRYWI
nr:MAG TPA: hypothetical protein [Caudoviricetes sp.]